MTRFRAGLLIGFAGGYYLGTRAGRERHEQINRALSKLRRNPSIDHAATEVQRAKAVVDLSRERVGS